MQIAVAGGTGVVGRHVVTEAERRGHDVRVLSRAKGVDLTSSSGLDGHLEGVEAIIDVTSVQTMSAKKSTQFFELVTGNLATAGEKAGVRHLVALSIIGAPEIDAGYYAGKRAQERAVLAHSIGTVVRAAQFHEFGVQTLERTRVGPVALVPTIRSQPVSTDEVAALLLDVAEGEPLGDGPSIAGPEVMQVADMARLALAARGERVRVIEFPMPGAFGRGLRGDLLLARSDTRIGEVTHEQWLAREFPG
ncbi:SDR family oxidoreductase [Janibacter anophelis]|uniref:SDR family oxidoreductase n=1 Tax=Janibacter anophelis TaxID=319054 RepID=UPI003F821AC3